jgi:hypothetical protein
MILTNTARSHGIPHSLRQLFNSSMAPAWRIAQPYCVALAPGAKSFKSSEPLWYAGCKTLSGEDKLCKSPACGLTRDPVSWGIETRDRDVPTTNSCSLTDTPQSTPRPTSRQLMLIWQNGLKPFPTLRNHALSLSVRISATLLALLAKDQYGVVYHQNLKTSCEKHLTRPSA